MSDNDRRAARDQEFADSMEAIRIAYGLLPLDEPLPSYPFDPVLGGEWRWTLRSMDEDDRDEFLEQLEHNHRLREVRSLLQELRPHLIREAARLGIPEAEATWSAIEIATGPPARDASERRSAMSEEAITPTPAMPGDAEWHHRIHGLTYEQTFAVCEDLYRRKAKGETWSQLSESLQVSESTLRDRHSWYRKATGR